MAMSIEGGCRCGAVRFTIDAEPASVRACWCRDCQYTASGQAAINVIFPRAAFNLTGETADFISRADSGNVMHRRFCPACGTPLTSEAEVRPGVVVVRAGALDRPQDYRPQATIWTASAPAWAVIDPDIPSFERQPPPPPQP